MRLVGDNEGRGVRESAAGALLQDDILDIGGAKGFMGKGVGQCLKEFCCSVEADHVHDFCEMMSQVKFGGGESCEIILGHGTEGEERVGDFGGGRLAFDGQDFLSVFRAFNSEVLFIGAGMFGDPILSIKNTNVMGIGFQGEGFPREGGGDGIGVNVEKDEGLAGGFDGTNDGGVVIARG